MCQPDFAFLDEIPWVQEVIGAVGAEPAAIAYCTRL